MAKYSHKHISSIKRPFYRNKKTLAFLLLLVGFIIFMLEITSATHIFHKNTSSGTIPSQVETSNNKSQEDSSPNTQGSPTPPPSTNSSKTNAPPPTSNTELLTPYGTFVSNHFPGKNGTSNQEQSACTTTPGASCYIQFTKDGVVKKLDAKTADNAGSVIWSWDVKDAGFASGSWKITAVTSLNGQTKSTNDSLNLEVQP
jgi:hypothetical protein